ncbi:protein GVQW3-like [Aphis craccivora]|uniref:Protein GVQW3-like n=1 Tax=Aphis craccivora TaxID=307492 RepID=A0A6G0YAU6_APHCR|nr:protein GVQW3-like [Aphis craccivora]
MPIEYSSKCEILAVIRYFFMKKKSPHEIVRYELSVHKWYRELKNGHTNVYDDLRSWRRSILTDNIVKKVENVIKIDWMNFLQCFHNRQEEVCKQACRSLLAACTKTPDPTRPILNHPSPYIPTTWSLKIINCLLPRRSTWMKKNFKLTRGGGRQVDKRGDDSVLRARHQ